MSNGIDKCQDKMKWDKGGGAHMLSIPTLLVIGAVGPGGFLKMHLQMSPAEPEA